MGEMGKVERSDSAEEDAWLPLALALAKKRKFWLDMITTGGHVALLCVSAAWERVTTKNGALAMFSSETVQVVTMSQVAGLSLLLLGNPKLTKTWFGKTLVVAQLYTLLAHIRRIRLAMLSGDLFRSALERGGIKNMHNATLPMLLSLLVPLRGFLTTQQRKAFKRESVSYASLEEIDPALFKRNEVLSRRIKLMNTYTGRGRVAQWLTMDILYPRSKRKSKYPVLMYIHGGGWIVGDKMFACRSSLEYLASQEEVVICTVNYRLAPEATFPSHLHDCKRALVWIKKNIAEFGGDPSNVFVAGESAGGHLTAMMALTAGDGKYNAPEQPEDEDTSIRGAIDIYGVHDMLDSEGHHARMDKRAEEGKASRLVGLLERVVFQRQGDKYAELFESWSPTHILDRKLVELTEEWAKDTEHVSHAELCPIMLIHGTRDSLAAFDDSRVFFQRIEKIRKSTKSPSKDIFCVLPGARHGFGYLPSPRSVSMAIAMSAFIHHHASNSHGLSHL